MSADAIRAIMMASVALASCLVPGNFPTVRAQSLANSSRAEQKRASNESVPRFTVWKIFCLSLGAEGESTNRTAVERLVQQFSATENEATLVLSSAKNYLHALRAIDGDAVRHVRETYGTTTVSLPTDTSVSTSSSVTPQLAIKLPRGVESLRDELARSGFLAHVQSRHEAAATSFLDELKRLLPSTVFNAIEQWVHNDVASRITRVDLPIPGATLGRIAVPQVPR